MQEALTLSNPPAAAPAPESGPAPMALADLATHVQTLRGVVQSQQAQLQALQQQAQSQPLVGWTTDSSWGLALEGLTLGLIALGLGMASMWGFRGMAPLRPRATAARAGTSAPPAFSDSMLYLADQEEGQDTPVGVSARLHDPHYDSRNSEIAHEEDPELDYYRMALTQQGLSVTAGAGQVDSDRIPLDSGPAPLSRAVPESGANVFANPPSGAEFDQRAAAEEVERVRRYLAQRRADRAREKEQAASSAVPTAAPVPSLAVPAVAEMPPPADAPAASIEWDALLPDAAQVIPPAPAQSLNAQALESDDEVLAHAELADGASLLAALSADQPEAPETASPITSEPVQGDTSDENLLEWESLPMPVVAPADASLVGTEADDGLDLSLPDDTPAASLPSAEVQLQLAMEFRDLGLWDEARERVLEVLAQPDDGHHAQAQTLLDELAQTAPVPLGVQPEIEDPWNDSRTA